MKSRRHYFPQEISEILGVTKRILWNWEKAGKIPKVIGEHIKVIDVQRLSPRTQVFLLEVDQITILVTENGDGSQAIQVKPPAVNS